MFRCGQEIKDLRGDVVLYVAQASKQIDNATTEKGRFCPSIHFQIENEQFFVVARKSKTCAET